MTQVMFLARMADPQPKAEGANSCHLDSSILKRTPSSWKMGTSIVVTVVTDKQLRD